MWFGRGEKTETLETFFQPLKALYNEKTFCDITTSEWQVNSLYASLRGNPAASTCLMQLCWDRGDCTAVCMNHGKKLKVQENEEGESRLRVFHQVGMKAQVFPQGSQLFLLLVTETNVWLLEKGGLEGKIRYKLLSFHYRGWWYVTQ